MSTSENSSNGESANPTSGRSTRRKLLLFACISGGLVLGYFYGGPVGQVQVQTRAAPVADEVAEPDNGQTEALVPNISLSPEEVVTAQMNALIAFRADTTAIHQVFAFASPANRSVTGPIDKFELMISREPYYSMVESDYWMLGRTTSRDGLATILVTTIDTEERISLYRFYLSLQTKTNKGCWMTDRVICLFQSRHPPSESI